MELSALSPSLSISDIASSTSSRASSDLVLLHHLFDPYLLFIGKSLTVQGLSDVISKISSII